MGTLPAGYSRRRARSVLWGILVATGLWTSAARAAAPTHIDLSQSRWSAINGFNDSYAAGFADLPGAVPVAQFPLSPLRIFNIPAGGGVHHFGLETTFGYPLKGTPDATGLALFFPNIGQSWALYLNGHPLRGEVHLNPDGSLASRRTVLNELIHLPHDWLVAGTNHLVLHVAGDASAASWAQNDGLGFYLQNGYLLGDFDGLLRLRDATADLSAIAGYSVLGSLSFFLFLFRRKEKPFLYFSLFTLLVFAYFTTRTTIIYQWFADTTWLTRLEYATLAASAPFALLFMHSFLFPAGTRIPLPIRIYAVFCGVLAAANLVMPFETIVMALRLWQWGVFPALGYSGYQVAKTVREGQTDAIKLAPGTAVFFSGVAWDVANSIVTFSSLRLTQFGFFFFVTSIAVILANRFLRMHQDAERLNKALVESEARLQSLFEATVEAICIHDQNRVVVVNPSFCRLFGVHSDAAEGTLLTDYFAPERRDTLLREFAVANRPYEVPAVLPDGNLVTAELINKTISYGGRPLLATSIRDITDRKHAAEKLVLRNEELENLSRIMVERELHMISLKKELDGLRKKG